jgi:voltage-gated sodium channel
VACQNFGVNAAGAQISTSLYNSDGSLTSAGSALELVDLIFTVIFTVELAINAFAHWFRPFVRDPWNHFDFCVVLLSLLALGSFPLPINVLRSVRALRVIRLFGRMGALRDIISALGTAILPVLNAFLILLIVGSICEFARLYDDGAILLFPCACQHSVET